jgi:hypothetical protein
MTSKMPFRKLGFVFSLVVVLSLLTSVTAYAQDGDATVELFRLNRTHVGIKITFPTDISGDFMGILAGNGFDCSTIPSNVVYCIGAYQVGAGASTLFLINPDTGEIVLEHVVNPPKPKREHENEPKPCVPNNFLSAGPAAWDPCSPQNDQ